MSNPYNQKGKSLARLPNETLLMDFSEWNDLAYAFTTILKGSYKIYKNTSPTQKHGQIRQIYEKSMANNKTPGNQYGKYGNLICKAHLFFNYI